MSSGNSNPIQPGSQHTQLRSVILTRQSLYIRGDRRPSFEYVLGRCFFRHDNNSCKSGRSIEPRYMPSIVSKDLWPEIADTSQLSKSGSYMLGIPLSLNEPCDSTSMLATIGINSKYGIRRDYARESDSYSIGKDLITAYRYTYACCRL
jgi:hypothetical protein